MSNGGITVGGENDVPGMCTVNGKVYDQYAVNYWLAGLFAHELPAGDAKVFEAAVYAYTGAKSDNGAEKRAWFLAGVAADSTLPGEPPSAEFIWPGTQPFPYKLHWEIGNISGDD
jgi:hypothetical protein